MTADNVVQLFPPYAGIICMGLGPPFKPCGEVDINEREYVKQMDRPDAGWRCPLCGAEANFDDERYEVIHGLR